MTDAELEARIKSAREYDYSVGPVTLRLRIPQRETVKRLYARFDGEARLVEGMAATLVASLVGVRGATAAHIGLDGNDPLPDTAAGARAFLADRTTLADTVAFDLFKRMGAFYDAIEDDLKN